MLVKTTVRPRKFSKSASLELSIALKVDRSLSAASLPIGLLESEAEQ